ncbi:chitobiase/beta-hexosaminidase C-terminal domain-containing protein [Butyrivibrio sp. MC2021]|uniref:chitobiase/beta-hexosaminidase C-terminal domain-containing protein n=1 Tax=Butyrivibrio sp. MC2021 TaxID=1408306 RepID=UPI00047CF181|nr:chitobiase/beta-hexosaminidase C-terminal domain-containing protein [Butyrivibrio sp. MC2021]
MKCPNCGLEIPEGHMYCDSCGTEINFVPDFEPEVENEINATLSGVAEELNKEERLKKEKQEKKEAFLKNLLDKRAYFYVVICVVVLIIAGVFAYGFFNQGSSAKYLKAAENARNSGNLDTAIDYLTQGNAENPTNSDIIFRLSDYYLEKQDVEKAVGTLELITNSALFPEDKIVNAYESIISIYKENGMAAKITELFEGNEDPLVQQLKDKYIPHSPVMTPAGGSFDDSVSISVFMNDGSANRIYYTVNGQNPDADSILYENEIILDIEGEYTIKTVSVNDYGIASAVIENKYVIQRGKPRDPDIMEPSGEYNQNTMIVAVCDAGLTIFYTTDGSDPTMEEGIQYVSPITMPVGTSHFRFAAFDAEGNSSDIVDRDYHLVYTRLVSTEQAVNMLVNTLVRLDILLDTSGKVRGQEGHNEYIYTSDIEIEGAGEYYMVVENHVLNDGATIPTGLIYAVNTHDGTVNRLGYDSSGKYTLITISNR